METLTRYDAMRTALVESHRIDDVKDIRDKAEALRLYAKQAGEGLENQNMMAEIKLRAERRCGELLGDMDRAEVGRPEKTYHDDTIVSPPTLSDMGITRVQSSRWQAIASVPEPVFEQHLATVKAAAQELTSAGVFRVAKELDRMADYQAKAEAPALPDTKYRIIYCDPPWKYDDTGVTTSPSYGGTKWHYPSMTADELCALPVGAMADADSVLFMWATSPKLPDALRIIDAWGFDYKTSFVWDKVRHNFGYYNSVRHEFLLIAGRGRSTPDTKTLYDSVQTIERTEHSVKPEEFRAIIDDLYPVGRRIELFARREAAGWERWGNE